MDSIGLFTEGERPGLEKAGGRVQTVSRVGDLVCVRLKASQLEHVVSGGVARVMGPAPTAARLGLPVHAQRIPAVRRRAAPRHTKLATVAVQAGVRGSRAHRHDGERALASSHVRLQKNRLGANASPLHWGPGATMLFSPDALQGGQANTSR